MQSQYTLIKACQRAVASEANTVLRHRNEDRPRWALRNVCHRHARLDADARATQPGGAKLPMVGLTGDCPGRSRVSSQSFLFFL